MTATKLSKSWRSLFSLRPESNNRRKLASSRLRIPDDIVLEIVKHVSSRSTILDLSSVSRHMRLLLLPKIYSSVTLRTSEQCRVVLSLLAGNPKICRQVRTLVVNPSVQTWASRASEGELDESWASKSIEQVAAAGFFSQIETFGWHGRALPSEGVWTALRTFCPRLVALECSIEDTPFPASSTLFEFSDLSSFTLFVRKCGKAPVPHNRHTRVLERLPERLWEMLIHRCPRLIALTIDGSHSLTTFWDMSPMLRGRWQYLKSLCFDMDIVNCLKSKCREQGQLYASFLKDHPSLGELRVGPEGLASLSRLDLEAEALPYIRSLSGPVPHNHHVFPKAFSRIECLEISLGIDVFRVPSNLRDQMWDNLHRMSALTSLSISLNYRDQDDDDYAEHTHALLAACPRLQHLNLSILPHIVVSDFSRALRDSPQIRSFTLTTVRKVTDEDLPQSAVCLVRQNPNLESFSIRYARLWMSADELTFKSKATFEVIKNADGSNSRLLGREVGYRYGHLYDHRSTNDLRRRSFSPYGFLKDRS